MDTKVQVNGQSDASNDMLTYEDLPDSAMSSVACLDRGFTTHSNGRGWLFKRLNTSVVTLAVTSIRT